MHLLFSSRHFCKWRIHYLFLEEVGTCIYGNGATRLWQAQKMVPLTPGGALYHPHVPHAPLQEGWSLERDICFQAWFSCSDLPVELVSLFPSGWLRAVCTCPVVRNSQRTQVVPARLQPHRHPGKSLSGPCSRCCGSGSLQFTRRFPT